MSQVRSGGFSYSHEKRGRVLVQDLTDWSGETIGVNEVHQEWRSAARSQQITAAVTVFSDQLTLGSHALKHLAQEWAENAQTTAIEKIAFVSEGIERRAVPELSIPQAFACFHSLDQALEWADTTARI